MKVDESINLEQDGFVFCPKNGECYTLNPLAHSILSWIKSGETLADIRLRILDEYEISESDLEADLDDFISLCIKYRLIEEN